MNPSFPPRGAYYPPPNMPPMPIPNLLPGQFPHLPPIGLVPLPVGLPNSTQPINIAQASMGITVPTGVTTISAPPIRKIIPNIIPPPPNQITPSTSNPKPHVVQQPPPPPSHYPMSNTNNNKQTTSFTNHQKPNKTKSNYNGPIITVFVGNINEKVSDIVIRQILDKCGNVTNWKRVKGPNGQLQAFGFCDYAEADSALRAIRLLHDFEIGDKKLLVKVDAKTNEKLESYAKENESKSSEEESNKEDEKVMDLIKAIIKENESEIMAKSTTDDKNESSQNNVPTIIPQQQTPRNQIPAEPNLQSFSDMDIEDEKKTLIHREIGKFRSTYKKQDEEKEKLDAERAKEREQMRRDKDRRDRDRNNRERDVRERLTPSRDRKIESRYDRESSSSSRYDGSRLDRNNDRNNDRNSDRIINDYRSERDSNSRSAYEDDEMIELRRQQREERKKEQVYQKRLKDWENREERKKRQYEKDQYRLIEKKKEEEKELLRLKQFLEDYNDDLDDIKYYKGSNFARKLREFEKEREDDERDRNLEKKELEDLRRKLADEGHPDPEMEAKKIMSDNISTKQNELSNNNIDNNHKIEQKPEQSLQTNNSLSLNEAAIHVKSFTLTKQDNRQFKSNTMTDTITIDTHITPVSDFQNSSSIATGTTAAVISNDKKKKSSLSLHDVFNSNEDDDKSQTSKKRKLPVFIDDNTDSNQSLTSNNKNSTDLKLLSSDDKRKQIKAVIDSIPTTKEELFKYEIEWDYVDSQLMERRIRPWINKKITEYIGEEEKALLDFICGKLNARCNAQSILDDVAMVLDDEAEVFIVKMLRLLIYEIEAKKLGLGK